MSSVYSPAIWLASAVWSCLSQTARQGVRWKLIRPVDLGVRVISVGNIQVGGAGKTPLVAKIAQEAHTRGLKVAILCRGYRGEWETRGGVLKPEGSHPDVGLCGDEAALLHELAPHAYIGVGADRHRQFRAIQKIAKHPIDLVVLDDGFQNWKIKKSLEIVALTSAGRGEVLFRDWPRAISRADLLVWTKGENRPTDWGKPLVKIRYRIPSISGADRVWMVTGLADSRTALDLVKQAGYTVERHVSFPDHARYEQGWVQHFLKEAQTAGATVAITGKDWVKWRELGVPKSSVVVFEPQIEFEEGVEIWNQMLWGASS